MSREVWFVTGSSSGLGAALVKLALSKKDCWVYGFSRTPLATQGNYRHFTIDLSDTGLVSGFEFPELPGNVGRIILVANAATLGDVNYMGRLEPENIIDSYALNVITPHLMANSFLHKYDDGVVELVVIYIGSGAASNPYDGWSLYGAGKAALAMQADILLKEAALQSKKWRIYNLAPGVLQTPMQETLRNIPVDRFSAKQRFVDLYQKNQLYDASLAAAWILDIVDKPEAYPPGSYRFKI